MVEHGPADPEGDRPFSRDVTVLAAGGTIAMAPGGQGGASPGAVPVLDAEALVSAVPGLLVVEARTVRALPSVQLGLADALEIAHEAAAEAAGGRGVVVTTGTDALEELAAVCDVVAGGESPVVLTGAIRTAAAPGADGPANLLDAVAVARHAPGGVYVVFGGEVHAGADARKVDSTSPRAFASPRTGPLGHVAEGRVALRHPPPRPAGAVVRRLDLLVPIVPTWLGDDGALLRAALELPLDGLVLVALGAGHVPPAVLEVLAGARVPVWATVRPERGALLHATYGFHGAEGDLRAAGVVPAAQWSPQAARMRLLAALGGG